MSSESASSAVQISTGARLHFGPLAYSPSHGRHFGGIGLMIDHPGWSIEARPATGNNVDTVTGFEVERVRQVLQRFRERALPAWQPAPVELVVKSAIPSHHGLGSGTQLTLAIGECLSRLAGACVDTVGMARQLGRGVRSAIGIYGYDSGGFLVDAGQIQPGELGDLSCRVAVPEPWRFVLVFPEEGAGLSGEAETQVLRELAPMSDIVAGRLSRLTLTEMLPALHQSDCPRFAAAVEEYGRLVGEFFRPVQGDVFTHPAMAELAERLRQDGISGMAQSSWGPTLAVPLASGDDAAALCDRIRKISRQSVTCQIVASLNRGRAIHVD